MVMNYKLKKISWWFGFQSFTFYPYIFYVDSLSEDVKKHEEIHIGQQYKFYRYGWYLGVAVWLLLYLAFLPVGWNPFRFKWEYAAYTQGSGYADDFTRQILRKNYLLWFMGGKDEKI